jgi:pimeloyl-ACP methyl ester carboxylesterase
MDIKKTTGYFTSFDGTQIYYEVRGSGRPLIMCYGLACLINHWTHQIRYFSQNYQTIVFDYRGHHNSKAPIDRTQLSIDAICLDIKALVDHLNIDQGASFWGHSFGVQILLRLYELHPELIKNFVFINGFAENPIKGMFGIDSLPIAFDFFREGYRNFPEILGSVWRTAVRSPLAISLGSLAGGFNLNLTSFKDIEVYTRGVASLDIDLFITLFDQMMNYDGNSVLGKINVPTLVVSGSKDGVTPPEYQEYMQKQIHGSELMRVPYGTHCTQLDMPDFVNLRVEKFLIQNGYGPDVSIKKPVRRRKALSKIRSNQD